MKIKNKFSLKIFVIFWLFCAFILVTVSLIAGQFTSLPWMSPREKLFINAHASVLSIVLTKTDNSKKILCDLNEKLKNTLYLLNSNGPIIYCQVLPRDVKSINKENKPYAYVHGKYLVSDKIKVIKSQGSYRLVALKSQHLYPVLLQSQVAYRLLTAVSISGIFCYLIALYLTYPLKVVAKIMSHFGKGELKSRVGNLIKKRNDEFTEIGNEFDNMANSIEDMILAKQQMLYNISHELRSPLARQLISLDLLKHTPKEEHQELITHIKEENTHINDLISNILTLAKLSTNTFPSHPKKTDVTAIILKAINNINFENHTSCIIFQGEKHMNSLVDEKLIKIAIENVIKNALTYAGKNDPIVVEGKRINNQIMINVIDQGPGINENDIACIFDPFIQSTNKKRIVSQDSGYGLGLSITKEIIHIHSGTIHATNEKKGGLNITIVLPIL